VDLPVVPPVKPMLAKPIPAIPDSGDLAFEPKWDGFRCIVFRCGDEIHLGSRNERPLARYFPDLIEPLKLCLPQRCVIDGEIVVIVGDRLAFDALQQRIHPAESRVDERSRETPASFIAFDVLAVDDTDLTDQAFRDRRAVLEAISAGFEAPVHLVPQTLDREVARRWYDDFEGAGLDGLIAKPRSGAYVPDKRVQFKVKHTRTADVVVAGYRMHKDGQGVGSLLVGLHDHQGILHHAGVATSFKAAQRAELVDMLAPYVLEDLARHPWAGWLDAEAHADRLLPGAPNRWSAGRPTAKWVPLRCELVAEVKYEATQRAQPDAPEGELGEPPAALRFRGTTRLVRWRGDRSPADCRYDQLETAAKLDVSEVLSAEG